MFEYLIVRNNNNNSLFDVVVVHYERSVGEVIKSALSFEQAQELQEKLTNQQETVINTKE